MIATAIAALAALTLGGAPPAGEIAVLQNMTSAERAALIAKLPKDEVARHLSDIPADALLEMGRREVDTLGTYALRLTKEERVDGKWIGPQTMELEVRESPLAIKGSVTKGPASGRKLLYNAALKPGQLRVREAGLLGMAGALWIDVDSSLARRDTKHPVTDLCYGALFRLLQADFKKAAGAHARTDVGFDKDGAYCIRFVAPKGVSGLYAREALLCLDPSKALLTRIEVSDADGPFEKLRYELLKSNLPRTDADFTPAAAGL